MHNKRFWFSWLAVWFWMAATDWTLHGMWLAPWYSQTAQFWRPQNEIMMTWLWAANVIFAWAFVWIYTKGLTKANPWHQAFRYGLAILLVSKIPQQMGMWATAPYPAELVLRWVAIAAIQAWGAAFLLTWVYTPKSHWTRAQAA